MREGQSDNPDANIQYHSKYAGISGGLHIFIGDFCQILVAAIAAPIATPAGSSFSVASRNSVEL
jgi:hypothetical protein